MSVFIRRSILGLVLLLQGLSLSGQVRASLVAEHREIEPGKSFIVALRLEHDSKWHTYWKNPKVGLPTSLSWTLPEGFSAGGILWPTPISIKDEDGAVADYGYEGDILLPVRLQAPASLVPGTRLRIAAKAEWLMCKEACVPGEADLELLLGVAKGAAVRDEAWFARLQATLAALPGTDASRPPAAMGLLGTLLLAYLGGLILNLMPCVFPVLGLKVLSFVQQAGEARSRVVRHGLVFTAGVLLSFWILAGLLALLRAGGGELGWGFQLQSPVFIFALAALMLVFGLNLSGVFEYGLRATSLGAGLQMKTGYAGSFFTGVLATLVATPCSAPFLAPALGAALSLSTAKSFVVFSAIALGLSSPYLALSAFPSAVRLLPRPGAWMESFKQFMAFPLYATVAFLCWVLAGQLSESGFLSALFGLVIIAMGAWVYGRWAKVGGKPGTVRTAQFSMLTFVLAGLLLGWPGKAAPNEVTWEAWSPARLTQLRTEGRIVYVDFTARWCATCQTNKRLVFGSKEVLEVFRERKVAALKADWTNRDPAITAELARWGRSAVPFNLVYHPGREQPVLLPELLTPGKVLEALNLDRAK